ncbi:MAG: hypothetical protein ACPGYJ_09650, partial [bacterium]
NLGKNGVETEVSIFGSFSREEKIMNHEYSSIYEFEYYINLIKFQSKNCREIRICLAQTNRFGDI